MITYKKMKNVLRSKSDIILIKVDTYRNATLPEEEYQAWVKRILKLKEQIENNNKVIIVNKYDGITIERI